jgi:hypothetical protein
MSEQINLRKNPSRESCEDIIRRILDRELALKGKNNVFKQSSDFMPYFESLYPASNSLLKQVQRAVKSLAMPKDDNGYFIPNKTKEQYQQELFIGTLLKKSNVTIKEMDISKPLFLQVNAELSEYLMYTIMNSKMFEDLIITMHKTYNGVLIYSNDSVALSSLLHNILTF